MRHEYFYCENDDNFYFTLNETYARHAQSMALKTM